MSEVVEDPVSELVSKGVEKIARRKNLTSQDLTVLLLHEQSRRISRIEKGLEAIVAELREFRREMVPLLSQAKDIADIRAKIERIEAKVS